MYGLRHGMTLNFLPDDVMLPVQFFGRLRNTHEDEGYHRLIYAILADCVDTYLYRRITPDGEMNPNKRERLFQDAKAWLFDERYAGPFSCAWICDCLNINVVKLREGLRAWGSAGEAPPVMPRKSPVGRTERIGLPHRR